MMDSKDRIQIIDAIRGLAIILSSFLFLSIYLLKELRIEVIRF